MRNHRFVESVNVLRQVGDAVSGYDDVSQRVVEICACIPEEESVDGFIDYAYSTVSILDDKGEDMVVSRVARILFNKNNSSNLC